MANRSLNLAPSQAGSSFTGGAPGVDSSALAKAQATRLPPPPKSHLALLAHTLARLPSPVRSPNARNLFLP